MIETILFTISSDFHQVIHKCMIINSADRLPFPGEQKKEYIYSEQRKDVYTNIICYKNENITFAGFPNSIFT